MRTLLAPALLVLLATASCSTATFDRASCQTDDDCAGFGTRSTCDGDGYCSTADVADIEPHIGFVFSSLTSDRGWSATHQAAIRAVAEEFDAPLSVREDVRNIDAAAQINELTEEGANIIFTASSGFIGATQQAANENPDSFFVSCCGRASGDNLTSYFGRMYQPIYVLGYVAAKMSCTKRLGIVAAFPFPQFVRHINAFTLGARRADPDVEVDVRWVNAFFNIEDERTAAEELMDEGADVIFAQSNSSQPVEARSGATVTCDRGEGAGDEELPVYRIGYHSPDACRFNEDQCISSAHWDWTSLYRDKIQSILDGTFDPEDVDWVSMTNSPESVVNYAALDQSGLVPGALDVEAGGIRLDAIANPQLPFVGPLSDNMGVEQIASGQTLSDIELDAMCYFVDGVIEGPPGATTPRAVPPRCSE
ncbi:MAG: BMP family ABC transporter substrate-binding protein [Polyangiales bacterium]